MVSNPEIVKDYERWFLSPVGMYVDEKEKELLINSMRFKRGERVLEIGCGTGRYVQYLTELELEAVGTEPVEEMARKAIQKSVIKKEQIIIGPYENIPVGDNSFENVIFMHSFAFSPDKVQAVREAYRIASKKIGIGFLNKHSLTNFFKVNVRKEVYKDAMPLCGRELKEIVSIALSDKKDEYSIKIYYTLYLPLNIAYLFPFVDNFFEKTNLPFGDFGMLVIKKAKEGIF
ncbi:MAG: class I SAM-dependent methyltransferase [Candidatus Goldbacteria bacterium]|jgi:ubiquinone/menaquinone biosynthesis C-methylase UbiE|nr:class I SAM-dependent methyltransferase [Candidatus Goldiibacteriota bacterium]